MYKEIKNRFSAILTIALFAFAFLFRCANPSAPTGGPIDSTPPKIVSIVPALLTTNFNAKEIVIKFDEYVQLKDISNQVLISPEMKKRPDMVVKGKSVVIRLESELDSATTYKINFGNAIVDNNESNPLLNFSYVFSTGDIIDSLAMSGQVLDAFTGDSLLNALVLLYEADRDSTDGDSTIYKMSPNSIARTDSMGVYLATNLKDKDYKVFALYEEASNGKYEKGSDFVAFFDTVLNPTKLPPFSVWFNPLRKTIEASAQVVMRVFDEPAGLKRQTLSKVSRPKKNQLTIEFVERDPIIESIEVDSVALEDAFYVRSTNSDTISIYFSAVDSLMPDTLKGVIKYQTVTTDSIVKDTIIAKDFALGFREIKKEKLEEGEVEPNPFKFSSSASRELNPHSKIEFKFEQPLSQLDSGAVILSKLIEPSLENENERGARGARRGGAAKEESKPTDDETSDGEEGEDTAEVDPIKREAQPFTFVQDSSNLLIWNLVSSWEEKTKYELIIPDSAFINIIGEANDSITTSFETLDPESFGLINITLENADNSVNYIISLTDEKKKDLQVADTIIDNKITFDYIRSGKYKIRVIEDADKNGVWDKGNLTQMIQPERVAMFTDPKNSSTFEAKENWELNLNIDLKALFKEPRPKRKAIITSKDSVAVSDTLQKIDWAATEATKQSEEIKTNSLEQ